MRLVTLPSLIFLSLFLTACSPSTDPGTPLNLEGNFSEQPLTTNHTFNLQQHNNTLFAATEGGLLQFDLSTGQPQPAVTFFDTTSVQTMLILDDDFWLASAGEFFTGDRVNNLFKSTDQGQSWSPFRNGYGGERQLTPTTMDGYIASGDTVLFARANGFGNVGRSLDGGKSWESVWETWENPTLATSPFVTVNPSRPAEVWAGGATALFVPFLITSRNSGDDWLLITVIENVEATVYDVVVHPQNSNHLIVGLSGAVAPAKIIRKSTDGGQSWSTVFGEAGVLALARSPQDGRVVYAAGATPEETLSFFASGDFGDSWETVEWEDSPDGVQVNDMVSVMEDGREVLYLGTNQGVYSYRFEE